MHTHAVRTPWCALQRTPVALPAAPTRNTSHWRAATVLAQWALQRALEYLPSCVFGWNWLENRIFYYELRVNNLVTINMALLSAHEEMRARTKLNCQEGAV